MVKYLRKNKNKISKKAMLCCYIAAAIVISNTSMVKAADINSSLAASSNSEVSLNDGYKFLIDTPLKVYDDINKVEKVAGFKFKIPNFLPEGNTLGSIQMRRLSNNKNGVQMYFDNKESQIFGISFQAVKSDPINTLKEMEVAKVGTTKNPQVKIEKQAMKLGEINGTNLVLSITSPAEMQYNGEMTEEYTQIGNFFVWEDQGVYYSIRYKSNTKIGDKDSKERLNLSEDTVKQIAESLAYPEEAKNVDYSPIKREVSTEIGVMDIYDKEDLEKAESLLGFKPKLPIKISDQINIKESGVGISYDSDIKNGKINYELNSFYTNKNGSITFWEGKNSEKYEDIKKNGYFTMENWKTKELIQVKAEKLDINNKEVFKYEEKAIEEGQTPDLTYIWKDDNGICYSVTFFGNAENSDEIFKAFINSTYVVN